MRRPYVANWIVTITTAVASFVVAGCHSEKTVLQPAWTDFRNAAYALRDAVPSVSRQIRAKQLELEGFGFPHYCQSHLRDCDWGVAVLQFHALRGGDPDYWDDPIEVPEPKTPRDGEPTLYQFSAAYVGMKGGALKLVSNIPQPVEDMQYCLYSGVSGKYCLETAAVFSDARLGAELREIQDMIRGPGGPLLWEGEPVTYDPTQIVVVQLWLDGEIHVSVRRDPDEMGIALRGDVSMLDRRLRGVNELFQLVWGEAMGWGFDPLYVPGE